MCKRPMLMLAIMLAATVAASHSSAQQPTPTAPDIVEVEIDVEQAENAAEAAVDATERAAEVTLTQAQQWLTALNTVPRNAVLQLLFVIGGVLLLVGGWRIYDWVVFLAGGLVGAAVLSSVVATQFFAVELLVGLVGFAIGAFIAVFLYYVAVFVVGAYTGMLLMIGIADLLGIIVLSPLVLLVAAVIGGLILLGLASELVIVIASLVGAQMLILALGLPAYWTLILAVLGVATQFMLARRFKYKIRRRPQQLVFRRRA